MTDIRYLVVAFEEKERPNKGRSNMSKLRKTLYDLSKNHGIKLMDFGTNFDILKESERVVIERIFENVVTRIETDPQGKVRTLND